MTNKIKPTTTEALDDRRKEIAKKIAAALADRSITSIETGIGTVKSIDRRITGGQYSTILVLEREEFDQTGDLYSSIGEGETYYEYGNFSLETCRPSPSDIIELVENWDSIVAAFAEHDARVADVLCTELTDL